MTATMREGAAYALNDASSALLDADTSRALASARVAVACLEAMELERAQMRAVDAQRAARRGRR